MEKYSVKKPFTVLVAVLIVFLLGFVSVTNLRTDLLPEISTPYLMVVTVYPGASPEKVETEVSEVLESALGTVAWSRCPTPWTRTPTACPTSA